MKVGTVTGKIGVQFGTGNSGRNPGVYAPPGGA